MPPPVRRQAFLLVFAAVAAAALTSLFFASGASADPTLASKQAQAQSVLEQIHAIDVEVERAAEAYNLANVKLDGIRQDQADNAVRLTVARKSLSRANQVLEERIVAIYTSQERSTAVDVILGATSIEDLINRLDTVERVSDQDAAVLGQVTTFRNQVKLRERKLRQANAAQKRVVAERAAQQDSVEAKLRSRQALLASVQSEIQQIQARERARQAEVARQARARLAAAPAPASASSAQAELTSGAAEPAAAAPAPTHGGVVGIAMQYLGVPYVWGGASPSGFDCSGFVMYVYSQVGVSLPHNAAAQYGYGSPVSRSALAPGDIVFFDGLGHNGLYIGGGQFIHAPHTGDVVKISNLGDSWYASTYVGARRP
jgi:cell wall-associated NlpC family hydrolase